MTEQQQNGAAPAPKRPEEVNVLLRAATTMHQTLVDRDNQKDRADHYERLSDRLEGENVQLRESVERLTRERDSYFAAATSLRSQLVGIGNAVGDAVKSITAQEMTPASAMIDDQKPIPQFLQNGPRDPAEDIETDRSPINLSALAKALDGDGHGIFGLRKTSA